MAGAGPGAELDELNGGAVGMGDELALENGVAGNGVDGVDGVEEAAGAKRGATVGDAVQVKIVGWGWCEGEIYKVDGHKVSVYFASDNTKVDNLDVDSADVRMGSK